MKLGMRSIIPALFGLLGMGATTPLPQLTLPKAEPDGPGFTKSRRTGGGYGNQTWRIYLTAAGWRLDFKRARQIAKPGPRRFRRNRWWLRGPNPKKKRAVFAHAGNPHLATAA